MSVRYNDHIPEMTPADFARLNAEKVARIQALAVEQNEYERGILHRDTRSRPIVSDDGKVYRSISSAAAALGKNYRTFWNRMQNGLPVGGKHWSYCDGEPVKRKKLSRGARRPVAAIDAEGNVLMRFPSHQAAAEAIGVSKGHISQAICRRTTAGDFHWINTADEGKPWKPSSNMLSQPLRATAPDGTVTDYESIKLASMTIGASLKQIQWALDHPWCKPGGLRWRRLTLAEIAERQRAKAKSQTKAASAA